MDLLTQAPAAIRDRLHGLDCTRDAIGLSGAGVLLFDHMVLKVSPDSLPARQEARMMQWLQGRLPVPQVLEQGVQQGQHFLLMTRLPGHMACHQRYLSRPQTVLPLLVRAIQALWQVEIDDCPVRWDLDARLLQAEQLVRDGQVDPEDADPATFGSGGFRDPAHLLAWLKDHRPPLDPVLSHGDLCLPNVLFEDERLSGFVDLGFCGVADRWQDLALCWRSLRDNTHGHYGQHPGFPSPDTLFRSLGVAPDREKLRYYLLLDELF